MSRFLALSVVIALALTLTAPIAALAQGATPAASPGAAVACTVAPRSAEELVALWYGTTGTRIATATSVTPFPSEADLPSGTPADAATVDAINAAIQEWAACFNSGDYLRYFALLTDSLAQQQGPQGNQTPDQILALLESTPTAQPSGQGLVVGPARDVRVLPDGRVGAVFDFQQSGLSGVVFVTFEQQGGQWLIAETDDVGEITGTPAAG
jgi:hypothetical protein